MVVIVSMDRSINKSIAYSKNVTVFKVFEGGLYDVIVFQPRSFCVWEKVFSSFAVFDIGGESVCSVGSGINGNRHGYWKLRLKLVEAFEILFLEGKKNPYKL
jgi:hypothetical protein